MLLTLRQMCSHLFFYELMLFTLASSCFIPCTYTYILINATELLFSELQGSMLFVPLVLLIIITITLPFAFPCLSLSLFFFFFKWVIRVRYSTNYGNSFATSTVVFNVQLHYCSPGLHLSVLRLHHAIGSSFCSWLVLQSVSSLAIFTYWASN